MKLIGGDWNPGKAQVDPKAKGKGKIKAVNDEIDNIKLEKDEDNKKAPKKVAGNQYKRPVLQPMDGDKVSLIASKLGKQESLNKVQKAELSEKASKIEEMEKELAKLKRIKMDSKMAEFNKISQEKANLEKENNEMKNFLKEYGLKWVGKEGDNEGNLDMERLKENLSAPLPKEIDLELVAKRIEELNILAEKDAKKIVSKDGTHMLGNAPPLPIGFYRNGLIIKGYKFHEYSSKEAQSMLSDILDGYFPYDLKGKYKDGVMFKIIDHTEDVYDPKAYEQSDNIRDVMKIDEQFRPLTKEEFLMQLPEKVMKHGRVIPIRSEIGKKLGVIQETESLPMEAQGIEVETHVVIAEKAGKPYEQEEIAIIRLRTENAKHKLIVKALATDTIQTIYTFVEKYSEKKGNFVIRRNMPQEEFLRTDPRSLKDLGLHPSAALIMQQYQ